jgi:hypothetical protein
MIDHDKTVGELLDNLDELGIAEPGRGWSEK